MAKKKHFKTFEGVVEFEEEDSGQALIATISDEVTKKGVPVTDGTMFVRIQSWQDGDFESEKYQDPTHPQAEKIRGKRVRVTIEVLEDQ